MAHEMSHVYMQHSAKQQGRRPSLVGGPRGHRRSDRRRNGRNVWERLAQSGIQIGAGTLMLKYSRGDEAQADSVGRDYSLEGGLSIPKRLADFLREDRKGRQAGGPQFLSDHPNPGNRRTAIQKEIAEWPDQERKLPQVRNSPLHASTPCRCLPTRGRKLRMGRRPDGWEARESEEWRHGFSGGPGSSATPGRNELDELCERRKCTNRVGDRRTAKLDIPGDRV